MTREQLLEELDWRVEQLPDHTDAAADLKALLRLIRDILK